MGDARRSQSVIPLSFTKKQSENATSQQPTKRPREDREKNASTDREPSISSYNCWRIIQQKPELFNCFFYHNTQHHWVSIETQPLFKKSTLMSHLKISFHSVLKLSLYHLNQQLEIMIKTS